MLLFVYIPKYRETKRLHKNRLTHQAKVSFISLKAFKSSKDLLTNKQTIKFLLRKTNEKVRALSLSLILFSACLKRNTPKTWSIDKKLSFCRQLYTKDEKINDEKKIQKLSRVVSEWNTKKPTPLSVSFQPLSGHTRCSKDKLNNISPLSSSSSSPLAVCSLSCLNRRRRSNRKVLPFSVNRTRLTWFLSIYSFS